MADFGSPVVNAQTAYNPMQSLSQVMNFKQQQLGLQQSQQNLQTGAQTLQQQQIETQQKQIAFGEQQAIAKLDPKKYTGDDGVMDADAYAKDAIAAAPMSGLGYERALKMYQVQNSQLGVRNAAQELNEKQRTDATNFLTTGVKGLRPDAEFSDVQKLFEQFKKENPAAGPVADKILSTLDPTEPVQTAMHKILVQNQALKGVGTPLKGTAYDKSGNLIGTTQDPISGAIASQPGQGVQVSPPPAITAQPSGELGMTRGNTLTTLRPGAAPPPAGGNPAGGTMPITAQNDPNRPGSNAPRAQQEAYLTATKNANEHVDSVRSADESYGNNKAISNAVRTLAGDAATGPGTSHWNSVMGILGTKGANNYQELGAFLDRQAATVRGQMGLPGTNAGAEDAKMIAGNTQYNAKVIQDKNNYTEALTDGLHLYRNGIDRVAGFGGQASPTQVAKFKSAWTNAFDPNVLIGENAYRRSKAEGDAFVGTLNPTEAASLKAKRQTMLELSNGKLPP